MLKAVHAQESLEASTEKAGRVAAKLEDMRLAAAAKCVRDGVAETLTYTRFPARHWRRIRTNNAIERLNREIRRRTRVVGTFPDGKSALMLATARLKYVADSEWGSRRYLDVSLLDECHADGWRSPAGICARLLTVPGHDGDRYDGAAGAHSRMRSGSFPQRVRSAHAVREESPSRF